VNDHAIAPHVNRVNAGGERWLTHAHRLEKAL
jgi:hypothetical protein